MPKFDVMCVGLTILDVLGYPVEAIPLDGQVDFLSHIRLTVAGPAAGTAVDCAKLGLRTGLVGNVGGDLQGRIIKQLLAENGVDLQHVQTLTDLPTSTSLVCVQHDGQRPALHARGASDYLTIDQFPTQIYGCKVFHMGGTGLLRQLDGEPTRKILAKAKNQGCITTFDLVGAREDSIMDVLTCMPFVDYFMPSIEEAQVLSGLTRIEDIAQFFLSNGATTCVFTLGAEGAIIINDHKTTHIPAHSVSVLDTTGCGDAFSAGFIAGLVKDFDWELAGKIGAAAAALVATGLGSDAGVRDWEQVWSVMKSWPLRKS